MGYVDLHSHVLPALDDGSPDMATTMAMLQGLNEVGFEQVLATPHQKAAQFLPAISSIHRAHVEARGAVTEAGIGLTLGVAAENFWDDVFFSRMRDMSFPRYNEGRAFLFEIPTSEIPVRFEDTLFEFSTRGYLPVMAHPERYTPFWKDLDRLERIGRSCALVVDLAALAGYHGFRLGRLAKRLVADGIAHAVASDVHTPSDIRQAAEGIGWIRKRLGEEVVTRLLLENPRCILSGELPDRQR
ncbi:MAG: hypothetical protein HY698_01065 [Deltaproteobacteria bacterium]|nr:hypothetical protein [Deltaproteobacteria bacterium]